MYAVDEDLRAPEYEDWINQMFQLHDKNGDGKISKEEAKKYFTENIIKNPEFLDTL